jgi:CDP-glycerol glycerophosphotransferase
MRITWFCFRGLYADNPRALYEALLARGIEATHTWLTLPRARHTFPPGTTLLEYRTPESVAALEEADLVVANDCISLNWRKRPGTTYLQTWHGTPIKRIHHDIPNPRPGWLDAPDRDIARWDHLLSPDPPSTPLLKSAFRYDGPIHETGYPRNDLLSAPDRDEVRARMRRRLGIADGTTAVLYAPTWRDDLVFGDEGPDFALPIDLGDFTRRLGEDHVLLVRLHSMVADRLAVPPGAPVVDVSDVPDSADLYLAADLLVTDYSSAMVDFAVTGKPILLYTYDLEHYRDDLRGFYFDLAEIAPGPLLRTSGELVDAIAGLDAVTAEHAEQYDRFRRTFCSLEDGHASDRVLDLLFAAGGSAGGTTQERG